MTKKSQDVTVRFASKVAARHFAEWLCGSGEQQYWEWMRCREEEERGKITAVSFHYHGEEDQTKQEDDVARYDKFMCDWIIRTQLGRLDDDEE